jgi:hypothetical protein
MFDAPRELVWEAWTNHSRNQDYLDDFVAARRKVMTALRTSEGSFGHAKTSSDSPAQTASAFWEAFEEDGGWLMPHEFSL